jgi:hypothetical protein
MAVAALIVYAVWLVAAFGARTWLQVRRTDDSGFRGISGRPGSARWWAGVLAHQADLRPLRQLAGDAATACDYARDCWRPPPGPGPRSLPGRSSAHLNFYYFRL